MAFLDYTVAGEVIASTFSEAEPGWVDNIYGGMPLLKWMMENGKIKTGSGGASRLVNLRYAKNNTAAFIADSGTISLLVQDNIKVAQYEYKTLGDSMVILDAERDGNVGEEQIFSIVEERMEDAKLALQDKLSLALFDSSIGANEPQSFATIIDSTGTIGGLAASSNAWWASTETASGSMAAQGLKDLTTLAHTISKSMTDMPNLSVTTQTIYDAYEGTMRGFAQFDTIRDGAIDPGVKKGGLKFKGTTCFFDENATSGTWYMANTNYLYLYVISSANFKIGPVIRPANQFADTRLVRWRGALCCSNRARQGKLTGLTS